MRTLKVALFALALSSTVLTSCRKDEQPSPAEVKTEEQLICGNLWVIDSITLMEPTEIDGKIVYDIIDQLPACELDDYINFRMDRTGATHSNVHVCKVGPATQEEFKWTIVKETRELVLDFGNNIYDRFEIQEVTDTRFYITSLPSNNPDDIRMRFIFKPL